MKVSKLFHLNYEATERIVINQGGTSSGKTYSILQVLFTIACREKAVITVVGQDVPNLKAGALRDAAEIAREPAFASSIINFNKSDRYYHFKTDSIIEFRSYEDGQDARSGKRDYLFINECNGVSYEVFFQLELRTKIRTYLDYNPSEDFWLQDKLLPKPGNKFIRSTYKANPFLSEKIIQGIEALKDEDEELWKIYGMGLPGDIRGIIFKNVHYVPHFPPNCKKLAFGLDFGFTNDPTTLVMIGELHGELYCKELLYETGLTNQDICEKFAAMKVRKTAEIFADAAEPKSIEEIKRNGYNIKAAAKGADSIIFGIDTLKKYRLNITTDSIHWRKEARNYKWKEKDGNSLNVPIDAFNHLWDAARYYAVMKLVTQKEDEGYSYYKAGE